MLRETTSQGLRGLVCPSRTSERGGEGDCVKEGEGEEGERSAYASLGRVCTLRKVPAKMCVCLLLQDLVQSCLRVGGGY